MGLDGAEILRAGQLLGEKLVLNEFVAFQTLGEVIQTLDYRTGLVMAISLVILQIYQVWEFVFQGYLHYAQKKEKSFQN